MSWEVHVSPHPLAARLAHIEPFHVMELLHRARELEAAGRSIIHMEIGEPDFPTAPPIIDAGIDALRRGETFYTPAAGLPALRQSIAGHYAASYGVAVSPDRIFVTPGASGALLLALALLVEPGQEVLLPDPGYPCNRHFVRVLNGVPRSIPVGPERGYQLSADDIADHWRAETVATMVATPGNPTGTLLTHPQLEALSAAVQERRGALIVDEIYHGLTYGVKPTTAVDMPAFVVNSFSKYFGMTGWRLGWLVVPHGYQRSAEKLAQNVFISASTPAQHAALACFTPAAEQIFEQRREAFAARRDYLLPALRELGFRIEGSPQGAFYLYADSSQLADDSFTFCRRLLEEAGVAVTPGLDFGAHLAERHVRFAYTNSLENLQEGVRRIGEFLGR